VSESFFIGGFARLTGRSVHTIRWYEAQGLIPGVERDRGGRRIYVPGHVEHLVFLEQLRRSGMTVAQMRRLSALAMQGWRTLEQRKAVLRAHRVAVEAEIARLHAALALIDAKVAYYDDWQKAKKRPPPPHPPLPPAKTRRGH
jgi:DNA-binding transcriptional MerR regulator